MHGHRSRVRVVSVTGRVITLVDWPHPVVGDLVDPGGEFLVGAAGLPVGQGRGEVVESPRCWSRLGGPVSQSYRGMQDS